MNLKIFKAGWIFFILALVLVSCVTIPETGESVLMLTSPQSEAQMGIAAWSQITDNAKIAKETKYYAQVDRVSKRLIPFVPVEGAQWEVKVFEDATPNAFALPGGKIGVHTGILPIAQNDAGLATILGHELAHVKLRHAGQRYSQQVAIALGGATLNAALEDESPRTRGLIMAAVGLGATVGVALPFSRKHEYQADEYGLMVMARAGYDPREAVLFWQRMKNAKGANGGPPEWLSTHPVDDSRINRLNELMPQAVAIYNQAPKL